MAQPAHGGRPPGPRSARSRACQPALASARAPCDAAHGAEEQVREVALPGQIPLLLFVTSDGDAHPPYDRRPPNPSPMLPILIGLLASLEAGALRRGTCPPCAICAGLAGRRRGASSIPGWSRSWGRRGNRRRSGLRPLHGPAAPTTHGCAAPPACCTMCRMRLRSLLAPGCRLGDRPVSPEPGAARHLPRAYRARVGAPRRARGELLTLSRLEAGGGDAARIAGPHGPDRGDRR